jgi:hypothetical protein
MLGDGDAGSGFELRVGQRLGKHDGVEGDEHGDVHDGAPGDRGL